MKRTIFLLLSILLATAGAVAGDDALISNQGEVFEVRAGSYAELFPEGDARQPETPLLAFDVRPGFGEPSRRRIVPSTGSDSVESAPTLVFDRASGVVNVLWHVVHPGGLAQIRLVEWSAEGWGEPAILHSAPQEQGAPRVAITHDTFELSLTTGQAFEADRSTIHLVWTEEEAGATWIRYRPIILVAGRYVGWSDTFTLGLESTGAAAAPASLPPGLRGSLDLSAAGRDGAVLLTFAGAASGALETYEIGLLPLELVYLGDQLRAEVLALADLFDPANVSSFADEMHIHIIGMGSEYPFHPAVVGYVADEIRAYLLEYGEDYGASDVDQLSADLRDFTIDLTAELFGTDLGSHHGADGEIIEIDLGGGGGGGGGENEPPQVLDVKLTSLVPAPEIGDAPATLFTSSDGTELIVAWDESDGEGQRVAYLEYAPTSGWSETFRLELDAELSRERAHELLAERLK